MIKKILTLSFFFISVYPIQCQSKKITLENIWQDYMFFPSYINDFNSMKDGEHYTMLERKGKHQEIVKYKFKNGKKIKVLFNSSKFDISKINNYSFSNNEKQLLIETEKTKIYRYSSKGIYYIYNLFTDKVKKISNEKIMYPRISPDGKMVAFVLNNNLFIKSIENDSTVQITQDGVKNKIINGASDWVYEEEFSLVRAFEWSNDSKQIAYYKFDESMVKEFSMDIFEKKLYPKQEKFKYPKAGEDNSVVKIYIYDIIEKENKFIFTEKDYEYIPRIKWTNNPNQLVLYAMNRLQNELDFIVVNSNDMSNYILFTEKDKYYIDIHDDLTFLPDNNFIWTSEKDGYNHIYLKNFNGKEEQLTKGDWEVTDFHGINSDIMEFYYTSTEEGSINRSLYSINLETNLKKKLSKEIGTNETSFGSGLKYYLNTFSTGNTAPTFSLFHANGNLIKVIEDNNKFNKKVSEYNLSNKEYFTINVSDTELNAWMIKPPNFDENKKYPLHMLVYGGPGSQQVTNSFGWSDFYWHQYLAQNGYIVACVDNRGTGGKGAEFKKLTYLQLGKFETIDQINAAKYFGSLSYIDKNRIGIQGWSYGGYMSSLAITKGADIFSLAVAVAPVTNWRYYDNIYTERYMRTPEKNKSGYDDNSPINHVDKLIGKYLLIHGSADDNVHYQNSMEMISELVNKNKQFDLFIYPDRNHGIYGGNTRLHLFQKITNFIFQNL